MNTETTIEGGSDQIKSKRDVRGSGRTTRQMEAAKKNSIFIWCNNHLDSPRTLARQLNRQDLVLYRLSILNDPCSLRGLEIVDVVVDHAAELTTVQSKNLSALMVQAA